MVTHQEDRRIFRRLMMFFGLLLLFAGRTGADAGPGAKASELAVRAFVPEARSAICYGPHRDGQQPGVTAPSRDQIKEDLQIMAEHWGLVRVYGSSEFSDVMLSVVRDEKLNIDVMLGAWIAVEEKRDEDGNVTETFPEAAAANRREVDAAIKLANEYSDVVVAVSVGNETQVFWSAHRSPLDILIAYVREVRSNVSIPVTVADDFNFWNKPESRVLAAEVDFVTVHAHPMWNGLELDDSLEWLRDRMSEIVALHPSHLVILGETGWATSVHTQGEQARLIKGEPGESEQRRFHNEVRRWSEAEDLTVFFFEAFDENWKGGDHPAEVEKHWGLFRADRSPKLAMQTDK